MDGIKKTSSTSEIYKSALKPPKTSKTNLLDSVKSTLGTLEQEDALTSIKKLGQHNLEEAKKLLVSHILTERLGSLVHSETQKERLTAKILQAIETNPSLSTLLRTTLES